MLISLLLASVPQSGISFRPRPGAEPDVDRVQLSRTPPVEAAERTEASTPLPLTRLAAPEDAETRLAGAASPSSQSILESTPACGQQHGAAAYVCCDGSGNFSVCSGRPEGHPILRACVEQHERDHLEWFATHLPDACQGKPRGACRFEMTPSQLGELECRGYLSEIRCLDRHRPLADGRLIGKMLGRQRQLIALAESRFGCYLR